MSSLAQRNNILALFDEAIKGGARQHKACEVIEIDPGTLRRWRPVAGSEVNRDARPEAERPLPSNSYSEAERAHILDTCNSNESQTHIEHRLRNHTHTHTHTYTHGNNTCPEKAGNITTMSHTVA